VKQYLDNNPHDHEQANPTRMMPSVHQNEYSMVGLHVPPVFAHDNQTPVVYNLQQRKSFALALCRVSSGNLLWRQQQMCDGAPGNVCIGLHFYLPLLQQEAGHCFSCELSFSS
jgi:hypothetical protein